LKDSNIPQFKDTVGWTHHLAGKHAEAAKWLRQAATEMPAMPSVHFHLGMTELALNNTAAARKSLERALELAAKGAPFAQQDQAKKTLQGL